MSDKSYYGKCGSCKYCVLGDSYKSLFRHKFKCDRSWSGSYVYADDDSCNRYEPDRDRTNDMIAKYDR